MSEEYFNQSRNSRGGGELFNASGEKLTLLNDFIARTERKAKDREDKKKATNYAVMSVNKLLEEKRLESTRRRLYDSPMSLATKMAIYGDEFHLREELDNGYPLNCRDSVTGRTLLHEAAVNGHLHLVRMLCREYKAKTNVYTILGLVTPLHLAVQRNFRQIVVILCQHLADPNIQDKQGCSALHYVQSKTVTKVLIRHDADPRIRNNAGLTPREQYLQSVEGFMQDTFVTKLLQQKEDEYTRDQFKEDILMIQMGANGSMDALDSKKKV